MRTREPFSVRWYVGIPKSGKTTLALSELARLSRETRTPALVIDSDAVRQLAGVPHVASIDEAIQSVWTERRSCAFTPTDHGDTGRAEVAALGRALLAGKDALLFIDEAHNWLNARSGSSADLVSVMRKVQHARTHILLTTQHLTGDVPAAAISCTDHLYVFRSTARPVLACLDSEFNIPPEVARSLPQYSFVHRQLGF